MSENVNQSIPTPHIEANDQKKIASTVLMPGDPLRAQFVAENFLEEPVRFNTVRNMFGYTGGYQGVQVSVMGSGMGMPSIGIYSYELFAFYGVQRILRIGSCGSYVKNLDIFDICLAKDAYSESSYAKVAFNMQEDVMTASTTLNQIISQEAENESIAIKQARIHSSDVFYRHDKSYLDTISTEKGCSVVEMESFALFANAHALGKEAACLLTVSDSFVSGKMTTAEQRQKSFTQMMQLALKSAIRPSS